MWDLSPIQSGPLIDTSPQQFFRNFVVLHDLMDERQMRHVSLGDAVAEQSPGKNNKCVHVRHKLFPISLSGAAYCRIATPKILPCCT